MARHEDRIVRVPLSVNLIRRIDRIILAGKGGYQSRTELIREALEAYLLELMHEPAPEEPLLAPTRKATRNGPLAEEAVPKVHADLHLAGRGLDTTVLRAPSRGVVLRDGMAEVADHLMFGLHNRDYPSIWAARHLAETAYSGPIFLDEFHASVVDAAWRFAALLFPLEKALGLKLTALFPTNRKKPESTAETFLTFAVGTCEIDESQIRASGPLFAWQVCQGVKREGRLLIGMTEHGYDLLEALDGISLEMPHPPEMAERFLGHLLRFAPRDRWGFWKVLNAVETGITRAELTESFRRDRPEWSPVQASTIASGYVARAREWGLLQPRLENGRYQLTEFGVRRLAAEKEHDRARI